MNSTTQSAIVAAELGCTQRHARRLIEQHDPRLEPIERAAVVECKRERLASTCFKQATAVSASADGLRNELAIEAYDEGPEVARLAALVRRLRRLASELHGIGRDLLP
jgi:hypothetical protein